MFRLDKLLKSKTVWAGIVGAAGIVLNAPAIDLTVVLQAGSLLLGAVGIKDAILKR